MTFMLVNYRNPGFRKSLYMQLRSNSFSKTLKNTVYVLYFLRGWGRREVGLNPNSAGELMKALGKVQFSCFWDFGVAQ